MIMAPARHTLRAALPAAGFLWEPRKTLLGQERDDRAVLAALRDHGGLASLQRGSTRHTRADIERALAGMFDAARSAVDADTDTLRGREACEFVGDHLWRSGVLAVDAFHHVASDYWGEADFLLWDMAQAPVEEGSGAGGHGNDPAAAAPHTLGTGASPAAGEPHPQTQTVSGGQDEDGDFEMGEAVEEVRLGLARTNLDEEDVEMEE
ncbi:hypothetical protein FJTKL_03845 [Diaporthe vaccinii]|uniref:Uncharacterized protein n=1 Tax=Diaporthe vaccinii TaxID=105482 RepID=A0ABR4F194_9PEZI